MAENISKRKLKDELRNSWFIPLRLSIFLLLFGAVILTEGDHSVLLKPFLFYSIATLLFLLVIQIDGHYFRPGLLRLIIYIHLLFELFAEGAIVHSAGQLTSQYSVFFLLTIVSASIVYRLPATISIATLASLIYAVASVASRFMGVQGFFDFDQLHRAYQFNDEIFYAVFLHLCTFYLVAFISGFLVERLRAKEGELSHASERLQRVTLDTDDILLNLHSGLITIDNKGEIIYFNRAAESIFGVKQIEVKGQDFLRVFGKQAPEFCERVLTVLKLARPNVRIEVEIPGKSGRPIPLGVTISVLGDESTGIRGVIAIFQDLTLAKEMEQALLKSDRLAAVGELSARIAHEIRNPLASISGSVQVLRNEVNLEGENAQLMELIVKESERLSRILSEFLAYARTTPTKNEKVELVSVTTETIELIRKSPRHAGKVRINFLPDSSTCYIIADADQLKQVLLNLLINAMDAVDSSSGNIDVAIVSQSDQAPGSGGELIKLSVADNGCGMTGEDEQHIFEPFFSRKRGGTGLGLAIVKRCLDNIGGRVKVESELGRGTTFTLHLRKYSLSKDTGKSPVSESTAIPAQ